jgi:hypothetical protein
VAKKQLKTAHVREHLELQQLGSMTYWQWRAFLKQYDGSGPRLFLSGFLELSKENPQHVGDPFGDTCFPNSVQYPKVPRGVVCQISAFAFHRKTTQVPHAAYLAIPAQMTRLL